MKRTFSFFNVLIIAFLITQTSVAQVTPVKDGNNYSLSVGNVELTVNASVGARITSLKLNGNEYIKQGGSVTQYGSTLWTSPQNDWGWPPLTTTDSKSYTATIDGNKMIFVSGVEYGISGKRFRIVKTFWANENNNSISVRYSLINTGTSSMTVSLWEITRVDGEGLTFWETGDEEPWTSGRYGPTLVNAIEEESDYYWLQFDLANGSDDKFFSGIGETGWFAHVFDDDVVFIKSFDDVTSDDYAPGEGEFEYYTAGSYIELENQGKYTTVPAGDTLNYDVTWHIKELPGEVNVSIGSTDLIDFVQGVVDTEIPTSIGNYKLSEVKLFPNPVRDIFTIELQNNKRSSAIINLSDMSGRLVLSKEFSNKEQIDISKLRNGVYFYKITSDNKSILGKLIKQN